MENFDITEQLEYQGNREKLLKNPILKLKMFQNNVIPIQGVSEFLSLTCKKNTVLKDDKSMIPVVVFPLYINHKINTKIVEILNSSLSRCFPFLFYKHFS